MALTPRKNPYRTLGRWLLYSFTALLLLLGSLSAWIFTHQDEIKSSIISALNQQLRSPVTVNGPIYVSLFENFPSLSLSFPNISIQAIEGDEVQDYPLISAERLSLSFSLLDLFNKNYRLQQLSILDAGIDLRFDAAGQPNYYIWQRGPSTGNESASFAIQKLVLKRVKLNYQNASENQLLSASLTDADFKGDFSKRKFRLQARAALQGGSLQLDGKQFLREQDLAIDMSMEVDLDSETVTFPDSELRLNRERLRLSGYHRWGEPLETDLKFSAERFRAAQILAFYQEPGSFLSALEVDGDVSLQGSWHYEPGAPVLQLEAQLADGKLRYAPYTLAYKGSSNISASYDRRELLDLQFSALQLNNANDKLSGSLRYQQRSNLLTGQISGQVLLANYQQALAGFELTDLSGSAQLNHRFKLYPGSDKPVLIAGTLGLTAAAGTYSNYRFSELSGQLQSTDDQQPQLKMNISRLQLDTVALSGQLNIRNYPALYDEKAGSMQLSGDLQADRWRWMSEASSATGGSTSANPSTGGTSNNSGLRISHFDLKLALGRLYWLDYQFDALSAQLSGHTGDMQIRLNNWQLAEGRLSGRLHWQELPNGYQLKGAVDGKQVNISKLFDQFHDFDQSFITHKHLSGRLDFRSSLLLRFDRDFNLLPQQLEVLADLDLQQGALTGFEPLNSLSRFVDAQELQNLRFQRMTNHIEIRNGLIDIPNMQINSSATRMRVSGQHSFDNAYTYYIQLSLSDLWKKRKQASYDPSQMETDADGGAQLYLVLQGQGEDFDIRYNKVEVRQQFKAGAKDIGKDFGTLIREEFDGTAREKSYETDRLDDIQPISIEADTVKKEEEKEFDPVYLRKPKKRRGG